MDRVPRLARDKTEDKCETPPIMVSRVMQEETPPIMVSRVMQKETPSIMVSRVMQKETPSIMVPRVMQKETPSIMVPRVMQKETPSIMVPRVMQKETGQIHAERPRICCTGHDNPIGRQLATPEDFNNHLEGAVDKLGLSDFYKPGDKRLKELAENAAEHLKEHPDSPLCDSDSVADLARLGLYHNIIFCDNSSSMKKGARARALRVLLDRIVKITAYLDTDGIQLRWLNYGNDNIFNNIHNPNDIATIFHMIPFAGWTPLGTMLNSKVIEPLILTKIYEGTLDKPVIVSVITDGKPNMEPGDALKKTIKRCKDILVENGYKADHVLFHISQIGDSPSAERFLSALRADKEIENLLYLTSGRLDQDMALYHQNENELQKWLLNLMLGPTRLDPTINTIK